MYEQQSHPFSFSLTLLFNAGCNEQVFSPKPWKKIWHRSVFSFSRKTHF